jgi:isocitrate/isopropylmalate dehydrogenase
MLDHLGEEAAAADLDAAVSAVLAAGAPDTTQGWDDALQASLAEVAAR